MGFEIGSIPFILISILIFFGNLFVCLLYFRNRILRTVTNQFVVSLAVCDILIAVIFIPLYIINKSFVNYVAALSSFGSLLNLLALTYDRYVAIFNAMRYHEIMNQQKVRLLMIEVWTMTLTITFFPLPWELTLPNMDYHHWKRVYSGILTSMIILIMTLTFAVYLRIFKINRYHLKKEEDMRMFSFRRQSRAASANSFLSNRYGSKLCRKCRRWRNEDGDDDVPTRCSLQRWNTNASSRQASRRNSDRNVDSIKGRKESVPANTDKGFREGNEETGVLDCALSRDTILSQDSLLESDLIIVNHYEFEALRNVNVLLPVSSSFVSDGNSENCHTKSSETIQSEHSPCEDENSTEFRDGPKGRGDTVLSHSEDNEADNIFDDKANQDGTNIVEGSIDSFRDTCRKRNKQKSDGCGGKRKASFISGERFDAARNDAICVASDEQSEYTRGTCKQRKDRVSHDHAEAKVSDVCTENDAIRTIRVLSHEQIDKANYDCKDIINEMFQEINDESNDGPVDVDEEEIAKICYDSDEGLGAIRRFSEERIGTVRRHLSDEINGTLRHPFDERIDAVRRFSEDRFDTVNHISDEGIDEESNRHNGSSFETCNDYERMNENTSNVHEERTGNARAKNQPRYIDRKYSEESGNFLQVRTGKNSQCRECKLIANAKAMGQKCTRNVLIEIKAAKTIGLIFFLNCICWLPIIIINMCDVVASNGHAVYIPVQVIIASQYIFVLNSLINPLIYAVFKKDFRKVIKRRLAIIRQRTTYR